MTDVRATEWKAGDVVDGKYLLVRPIAKGGMGSVWEAQNRRTERRVAIKFMLPELIDAPATVERFFREAKASARIDHPCIVDVLDLGTLPTPSGENGAPYLVLEYLEGRSLEQLVEAAPLAPIQAAALMLEVVRALVAAHAAGIIHRDLKPGNVFIAKKGEAIVPKILDFGISKITSAIGDMRVTRTGAVLGSPAYMSPEQARGRTDIDGRADVWAIGVILYEAVSNKLPFTGENYNQVMMAITLDEPTPLVTVAPSVDDEFLAIVGACLHKDRDLRPSSMEKLATMLDRYVAPRAAFGIPPVDIGEHPSDKRLSTYRIGTYAVPRAAPASTASHPPRSAQVITTVPNDVQVTVGAVTMVEPARGRSRALPVVVGVALLASAAGVGFVVTRPKAPAKTTNLPAAVAASSPASATTSVVASTTISATPSVVASASASASSSAKPATTPSSAVAPVASKALPLAVSSGSASASGSVAPKPSATYVKPKPKASEDGPANVGPGPGF